MVRLIPKDENFFDLFVADAENLLLAARELDALLTSVDARGAGRQIQRLEKHGDSIDREIRPASSARSSRRSIARTSTSWRRLDDVVDGIQDVAETCVIYGVDAPTPEARSCRDPDQPGGALVAAVAHARPLQGHRAASARDPRARARADGLSRAAIAGLFRPATTRSGSSSG